MSGGAEFDLGSICEALPGVPPAKKKAGELRSKQRGKCWNYVKNFLGHPDSASPQYPGGVEAKRRLSAWVNSHEPGRARDEAVEKCVAWFVARAEAQFEDSDED